ncbi:two component transcriptional regulator, AraC family [Amphibacillus marinus]|uniref:Two component transcriptional regulator, AraC family n=1 Tax=Amphibacillus marinus TaxID=872970 RepID=A0A1H8K7N8_9BACI|nr:response regulator transcription factor [Amphibacillus marinus]SEN88845.1 two component transcriptional regulator, AraC family [Amphibacillus marinus]
MDKIVIIDDEQFVRKGIIALVDWDKINYQVVGEASNGEDALDLILQKEPDVVLTDIRMPVYDGLKLIQYVKESVQKVPKFIILSGYNDFKYAQRAVRLGVNDFILKPVDREELEQTLLKLSPLIEQERVDEQANRRYINLELFQRIIAEREQPSVDELARLITQSNQLVCYVIIDIRDFVITEPFDKQINKALATFSGDPNIFVHAFEREGFGLILQQQHFSQHLNELSWFLLRMKNYIEQEIGKNVFVFAGEVGRGLNGIRDSYRTALVASKRRYSQLDDTPLMFNNHLASCEQEQKQLDPTLMQALLEKIEENEPEAIIAIIDQWVYEIQELGAPIDAIKLSVFQLERELKTTMQRVSEQGDSLEIIGSIIEAFNEKKTLKAFKENLTAYALEAGKVLCRLNKEKYNGEIYKVKRYINNYYHENLTLKKMANRFFMNPVYLGQLFKKTYGVYFKDYLLQVRIEKAKQILRQTDMRIYQVAEAVGFGSPDYFVTQFEKIEGSTPSKYRQGIIN